MKRWIGWLIAGGLLGVMPPALAQSVYRCRAADGALAFQDHPCARGQAQSEVTIAAPPPAVAVAAAADGHGRGGASSAHRAGHMSMHGRVRKAEPLSYECRAANGEVFYRHAHCPSSLRGATRGAASIAVSAVALPRSEACRRIARTASIGDSRNDTVSTYERNLGRDPCRRW